MEKKTIIKTSLDGYAFGFTDPENENNYLEVGENTTNDEAAKMLKISAEAMEAISWNLENLAQLIKGDLAELYKMIDG